MTNNDLKNKFLEEIRISLNYTYFKEKGNIFKLSNKTSLYVKERGTHKNWGWGVRKSQIERLKTKQDKWCLILLSCNANYCFTSDEFDNFIKTEKDLTFSQGEYKVNKSVMKKYDCNKYCNINELNAKII